MQLDKFSKLHVNCLYLHLKPWRALKIITVYTLITYANYRKKIGQLAHWFTAVVERAHMCIVKTFHSDKNDQLFSTQATFLSPIVSCGFIYLIMFLIMKSVA